MPQRKKLTRLPLIRLSLAMPMVNALEATPVSTSRVLAPLGLTLDDVRNTDLFVTAPKMYELVETLAGASGNPFFGFRVGERLDPYRWSPLRNAVSHSTTVGEILLRFMEDAETDESSVQYLLTTRSGRTTFREQRFVDGGITPRHNDGFTVAYLLTIMRRALGGEWNERAVIAHVCDPRVIPGDVGFRVAEQDTLGASITFPSDWLIKRISLRPELTATVEDRPAMPPPTTMLEAFREAVTPHIDEFEMSLARAAEICGMSKRTLTRRMRHAGTTVQKELDAIRRSRAEYALRHRTHPIREIAASVGYADPTVFSRAFKRWTGVSPSVYRRRDGAIDRTPE